MSDNLLVLQQKWNELVLKILESGDEYDGKDLEILATEKQLEKKLDGYYFITKRLKAEADFFDSKAKEYTAAKRSMKRAEDFLKNQLKMFLMLTEGKEASGESVRFKLSKAKPSLIIKDSSKIPAEYKRQVVTEEIDKDMLRNDLKDGKDVEGAFLEESFSLRSHISKQLKGKA